jgi:hypothetical protein
MLRILPFLLLVAGISGYPNFQDEWRKRKSSIDQVAGQYDYIIVGGVQSGVVMANRLSEDGECRKISSQFFLK